jgi:hypothetical protein
MNKRSKEDPEFAEKLRENCRVCNKKTPRVCYDEEKENNITLNIVVVKRTN